MNEGTVSKSAWFMYDGVSALRAPRIETRSLISPISGFQGEAREEG